MGVTPILEYGNLAAQVFTWPADFLLFSSLRAQTSDPALRVFRCFLQLGLRLHGRHAHTRIRLSSGASFHLAG